jgi:hypothetical protein
MAFCHIYARKDGTYRVRMHGTISRGGPEPFLGGTVTYTSTRIESEVVARQWVDEARERDGLEDMPEPRVIRRGTP